MYAVQVFLIRDFISEKQAKEVWDLAYSKLKDSKIILSNGEEDIDDWRSGAHAWLRDADSEFIDGMFVSIMVKNIYLFTIYNCCKWATKV